MFFLSRGLALLAFNFLFTRDVLSCLACTRHVPITNRRKERRLSIKLSIEKEKGEKQNNNS